MYAVWIVGCHRGSFLHLRYLARGDLTFAKRLALKQALQVDLAVWS